MVVLFLFVYISIWSFTFSITLTLCLCRLEVTVTSLHPPRLCRNAVLSIKPTFLSSNTNQRLSHPHGRVSTTRFSLNQQMRQQRDDEGLQWNVSSQIWSNVQKGGGVGVSSTGSQGKSASRLRCRSTKHNNNGIL